MLERAGYLFSFDYLQFAKIDVSMHQLTEEKGFTCETFHNYISAFPFYSAFSSNKLTFWFEFQQLCSWFTQNITANRVENSIYDSKALMKLVVLELKTKYPKIIKFFIHMLSVPVSEAICKNWGSVINSVMIRRPMTNDDNANDIGTADMRVYVKLNGPPPEYI